MHHFFKLILWITIYLVIAFAIGQTTQSSIDTWYRALEKPFFNPPNWVFPIAWSILYVLIATAGWRVWQVEASKIVKRLFVLYTFLNWTWTPIFFGAQAIYPALIWLGIINAVTVIFIYKSWLHTKMASLLMVAPLLWTLFAGMLNYYIWVLNS